MEAHRREGGGCGKVFSDDGISPGAIPRKSPSVRSSVPSIVSSVRLACRQVALVEVAGRGVAVVVGVAVADRARHQHRHRGRERRDRGAARHHRLTCRAVRGRPSARASPSRTRERLDGRTTRPTSSRSRRIRPTSAFNRTDAESTAEVYERVMDVLRAVSDEGAGCARFGRVRRAEAARIKEHFGRERLWNGSTAAKTHQPLVNARSRSVLIPFSFRSHFRAV